MMQNQQTAQTEGEKKDYEELEKVEENKKEVFGYLENLETSVNKKLNIERKRLESKYVSLMLYLQNLKQNVSYYEEKLKKLEKDYNNSSEIKDLLASLNNYQQYAKELETNLTTLDSKSAEQNASQEEISKEIKKEERNIKKNKS